jgi:hypothetical protein
VNRAILERDDHGKRGGVHPSIEECGVSVVSAPGRMGRWLRLCSSRGRRSVGLWPIRRGDEEAFRRHGQPLGTRQRAPYCAHFDLRCPTGRGFRSFAALQPPLPAWRQTLNEDDRATGGAVVVPETLGSMRSTTSGGIKKHQLIQNHRSRFLIPARIPASVKLVRASKPQATIPCTKSMTGLTA